MAKKSVEEPKESKESKEPKQKLTKTEAVRRALEEGVEKPQDGVDWIVSHFGEEYRMPPGQFSSYKSQLKSKAQGGGGNSERRGGSAQSGGGVEVARQVNKLVKTYDIETVQAIASVLYQHDSRTFHQALTFLQELHKD